MLAHVRQNWPLAAGALASIAIHLAAAALIAAAPNTAEGAAHPEPPTAENNDPVEPPIRLGIERSRAATITWIGFEDPTPHQAPEGETEQPALTLAPPAPLTPPESEPAPPSPPSEPSTEPATEPVEAPPEPTEKPLTEAENVERSDDAGSSPGSAGEDVERSDDVGSSPGSAGEDVERSETGEGSFPTPPLPLPTFPALEFPTIAPPPPPSPSASPAQPTPTPAAPPPNPASPPPRPPSDPGIVGPRESEAFALKKPILVEPGKPAAAEGLEIMTVRPRWATFTLLTASPRNPLVEVRFTRDGRVHRAIFIEQSGNPEVDQPILDAVYAWTAKGAQLEALPVADPDAKTPPTIKLAFRLVLRR